MRLALTTWRQVEAYLETKRTLIVPVGSTEQHGPNGLIGTDHLIADALARAVGERLDLLVHPPLTLGMSQHHLAFPGSASLTSATLARVLTELAESMARHGFRRFFWINGHGGNTPPASAAASDLLARRSDIAWHWRSWWLHPRVVALEEELFGDRNGSHASAAEISITMFLEPGAVAPVERLEIDRPAFEWPLSPEAFRATFPDGRMMSDPSVASAEAGERLFDLCVELYAEELAALEGGVA